MVSDTHATLLKLGIDPEKILAELSLQAPPLTIFLTGSVIEGYGNAESDLDVFLVYSKVSFHRADYDWGTSTITFEYTSEWRLDVETWAEEQLVAAADRLNNCPADDWNACLKQTPWDVQLSHRVRVGVPIQGEDYFHRLHQAFDFQHLSRIILTRCLASYTGIAEDAAGAIVSRQHGAALLMARQALQFAVDALLAVHGETNTKEKWRFFKLMKLGDPVLLEHYWALETPCISQRDQVLDYAKECLTFSNQLILEAQKMKT